MEFGVAAELILHCSGTGNCCISVRAVSPLLYLMILKEPNEDTLRFIRQILPDTIAYKFINNLRPMGGRYTFACVL